MSFVRLITQLFAGSRYATQYTLLNTRLIVKYLIAELSLLKFALESSILKRQNGAMSGTLLVFFKKNCFLRDYVFFWQSRGVIKTADLLDESSSHFRFAAATNAVDSVTNHNLLPLSSLSTLKQTTSVDWTLGTLSTTLNLNFRKLTSYITNLLNTSFSFGFLYIQGLVFVLFIDACLTDDEPLWEPIEWSLVQTWILFIFSFAWIAENLIVSRYGSYTGRDKRVWLSWYKTFWLIEGYYAFNYGVACVFVIVPFYFETNYNLSFVYSWWHWYSRVFFFKFISIFTIVLFIAYYLQMSLRWLNWKKGFMLILLINIFLSYLIYTQFIMTFFGYFTNPVWYQQTRPIDYVQLSHEPARWGWGSAKKDHFTYHNVKTVFWFKNDGPFASSFLLFQTFLFLCIFLLYIYWITLLRRVYAMKEIPLTYTTYCVSSLKQFFYFFLMFYIMIFLSYTSNYARFPIEFLWTLDTQSWYSNFVSILLDYPTFILAIFGL